MSYTYLLESGEEFSAGCFSDIPVSVLLRLNLTVEKSCCNDNEMESCQNSQYGMMCEHSMENRGEGKSISSVEDFHAKTSVVPEKEKGLTGKDQACGQKWRELSMKYDLSTHSWKTALCLWEEDLLESSVILPRWGMMQDGEFMESQIYTKGHVSGKDYGFWGRPTASVAIEIAKFSPSQMLKSNFGAQRNRYTVQCLRDFDYIPSPEFPEWLMGWPEMWSDIKPLAMDKVQLWLQQHSGF